MNVVTSQETRRTVQGRNNKGVFKEAATRWGGGGANWTASRRCCRGTWEHSGVPDDEC